MKNQKIKLICIMLLSVTIACTNQHKDSKLIEEGKAVFLKEKYNEAIPLFSKAISKNNLNDTAYAYRGYCNYFLENYSKASSDFAIALKLNQNNEIALFGDACINWNLEDYNLAFQEFNQLIHINPNHDKAYFYRGRAFLYLGDTIKSTNDLSKALEIDSCFIDTYYLFSSVLVTQKKFEQADKYLELAMKCKQKTEGN